MSERHPPHSIKTAALAGSACILILLSACTVPGVRRTVYPDGFLVAAKTETIGAIETSGKNKTMRGNSINGLRTLHENIKITQVTHRIPNQIKGGFGVVALIVGLPDGVNQIKLDIEHPEFRLPDGRVETHFSRVENLFSLNARADWDYFYSFDHPYELTPGVWKFSLTYRDRVIYQESLEVYAAPASTSIP